MLKRICKIDKRIEKVIHSHESARSFTGDYLDANAIKISHFNIGEITRSDSLNIKWYRGDQLPKLLDDAMNLTGNCKRNLPWFHVLTKIRTSNFYIYPWSIYCHGIAPTADELILIRPADKMIYYLGVKM